MSAEQIFFMGTGTVGRECLKILRNATGSSIECLTVEKEQLPTMEPLCRKLAIPYRCMLPGDTKDFLLRQERETLIISAHNEYLFPREVVEKPNLRIINFHNAHLPDYRGRNAPTWEIYEEAEYGGATWHEVAAGIDTGGIIVQEKVVIGKEETALSLLMRCARAGIRLLQEHVAELLSGDYQARQPSKEGKLYLSKQLPNEGWLDSCWDMPQAYRFLRAMDYNPIDIMPLPRVKLGESVYEIIGYDIQNSKCPRGGGQKTLNILTQDRRQILVCSLKEMQ